MERHPVRKIRLQHVYPDGKVGGLALLDATAREALEHVAEGRMSPAGPEQVDALTGLVLAEILDDHLREMRKQRL